MKILVACEESQAVTIAMRKFGLDAYSRERDPINRAKTFPGIAAAMADQWGTLLGGKV